MKKFIITLMAIVFAVSCQTRYEFDYNLKYTVGDKQYADSGKVTTNDPHSVPIAVAYQNSIVVDTYPVRVVDKGTVVVYQGETPGQIDTFEYRLNKYYTLNKLTWNQFNTVRVIKEEEEE